MWMEIKSAVWQRIFVLVVFGLIGACCLSVALKEIFPDSVYWINNSAGYHSAPFFCAGMTGFFVCFWSWWKTEKHHLRADDNGILQKTGFRNTYIAWQKIAFYRLERVRGTKERMIEPVLYDEENRVLFRSVAPVVVGLRRQDEEREAFWDFVESKLPGKLSSDLQ